MLKFDRYFLNMILNGQICYINLVFLLQNFILSFKLNFSLFFYNLMQ